MGAFSKFAAKTRERVGVANAVYVGVILAYVGGIAIPRWINNRDSDKARKAVESALQPAAAESPINKRGKKKGPAVNKEFFAQLKQLIKVSLKQKKLG